MPAIRRVGAWRTPLFKSALATERISPRCSSAGRLFDAVAAALDLFAGQVDEEGEAAAAVAALVTDAALERATSEPVAYRVAPSIGADGRSVLRWDALWPASQSWVNSWINSFVQAICSTPWFAQYLVVTPISGAIGVA